jgi:hypothetical protein
LIQSYTGALTGNCTVTLPNVPKIGWAQNSTSGGFNVILTSGVGTTVSIPPDGFWYWFQCDGAGDISLPSVGFGPLKANSGITAGSQTITNTATLTTNIFGQFIELKGASAYTVTLPTPVGNPGGFRLLLGTTSAITLGTPAGTFLGPTGNSTATIVLSQAIADTYLLDSDGSNWSVTALPNVGPDGTLTVEAIVTKGLPPGVQFGDMKHSALGIEGGGWRLCYGQARPQTDPFWVFMIANGLTASWRPGFTGSSTYNMPDARDMVLAGLDNMGGTDRGLLTTAIAGFDPTLLLNVGGDQRLQTHNHTATDSGHNHADSGHGHADSGHGHGVNDGGHSHETAVTWGNNGGSSVNGYLGPLGPGTTGNISWPSTTVGTGVSIDVGTANIEVGFANIETGEANITVAAAGAGGSQNVQPTMMAAVLLYVGA